MKRQFILSVWIFILSLSSLNAQIAAIDVDKGTEKVEVEDIIIVFKMHLILVILTGVNLFYRNTQPL